MRDLVATCRGEWPNTSMCPLVGYNSPKINFTVVDLPDPFGPSSPNTSPRLTSKSTSSTARALGRPQKSLKTFVSPRTETIISSLESDLPIASFRLVSVSAINSSARLLTCVNPHQHVLEC